MGVGLPSLRPKPPVGFTFSYFATPFLSGALGFVPHQSLLTYFLLGPFTGQDNKAQKRNLGGSPTAYIPNS